jgi:hypothetical protein
MNDNDTLIAPRRLAGLAFAGLLGLGSLTGIAACTDEDGDGGETDEEIQDVKDGADEAVDSVEDEVDEETDAQDKGSNED